jgi:hypothetical protein
VGQFVLHLTVVALDVMEVLKLQTFRQSQQRLLNVVYRQTNFLDFSTALILLIGLRMRR